MTYVQFFLVMSGIYIARMMPETAALVIGLIYLALALLALFSQ